MNKISGLTKPVITRKNTINSPADAGLFFFINNIFLAVYKIKNTGKRV